MSRKYIRQQIIQDFVYPNNEVSQYDVDNIVHNINDNSVSGTVASFSATTITSTGITFSLNYTWNLNGAERWIRSSNELGILSVHMLAPGQEYYKPWRLIQSRSITNLTATTFTETTTFTATASQMGLTSLPNGTYYFEVRFIGHRSIYPICLSLNLSVPTPTPTPTMTPTITPTPTRTPDITTTPTPTPTPDESGVLYVYARYFNSGDELGYTLNGGSYLAIGDVTSTSCDFLSVITGVTNGDIFIFQTLFGKVIAGSTSTCPSFGFGCNYTYTFTGTGSNFVYLTIDGSQIC
jgi:hypothetical protein